MNEYFVKNGMVEVLNESGCCYESYLYWWEYGKKCFYVYGNVKDVVYFII